MNSITMKSASSKKLKKVPSRNLTCEPVQVFCRIRPLVNSHDQICLNVIPPCHVQMTPPSSAYLRNGTCREMRYTFKQVFDEKSNQKVVFETVALPMVQNVLSGRNALLFTYGVTGSGKTYTMTGSAQDGGIMPRCLDVIFNSISEYQAHKYIFKPDKLNSFDIQNCQDAKIDRDQEMASKITASTKKPRLEKKDIEIDMAARVRETGRLHVDDDNCYAVFIAYVEIYNNTVYDLLEDINEEGLRSKGLQSKIIREDCNHNMFVHGVNEIEVTSSDEAFEIYYKGQKRRRLAQTALNSESSRSHSIFTLRIVQAPLDESGKNICPDKSMMTISQLSLVDLAGSERTNRTKNTGQRLREAANINNSLLTLRTCLEILRENQNGANKIVPYRDSRLTHLFKTFLDGEGQVSMVICVSPHVDDYDEIMHVMKFAEISQDVQITVPTPIRSTCFTPGRRKAQQTYQQIIKDADVFKDKNVDKNSGDYEISPTCVIDLPDVRFLDVNDDYILQKLVKNLKEGLDHFAPIATTLKQKCSEGRKKLLIVQRESYMNSQELATLRGHFDVEKEKVINLENKALSNDTQITKMKRKLDDYEVNFKRLKRELSEKEIVINKNKLENEKTRQDFAQKMIMAQEKLNRDLERKLKCQKSALQYEMRNKENKLKAVKKIIASDDMLDSSGKFAVPRPLPESRSAESLASEFKTPRAVSQVPSTPSTGPSSRSRPTVRKLGTAVANKRYRRSRSAGENLWLEHCPGTQAPLGTLMQPIMKKKSITNLTDSKDVTQLVSKYCLMTQGQDSDGDIETRLYKGDVIPTAGGGAQVMFNDMEVLHQLSPTSSPPLKRPGEIRQKFEQAAASAPGGFKYKRPKN